MPLGWSVDLNTYEVNNFIKVLKVSVGGAGSNTSQVRDGRPTSAFLKAQSMGGRPTDYTLWLCWAEQGPLPSQDEAFVNGPLWLRGLAPQAQMLQCVVEMLVNLLRFFTGLKIGEVFSDLLDKLVQNLNCDLQNNVHKLTTQHAPQRVKGNLMKTFWGARVTLTNYQSNHENKKRWEQGSCLSYNYWLVIKKGGY